MAEPTRTPIDQNLVDQIAGKAPLTSRIRLAISQILGIDNGKPLSPNQPIAPVYQDEMAGRGFDYDIGYNLRTVPRGEEPTTFQQLRGLADSYDLVRLLIETRKDQICKLEWQVIPSDSAKEPDSRCAEIEQFLKFPNKIDDWSTWLRMLLEDMLVIDAATICPVKTNGGQLYALDVVDGATIRPLIDYYGRSPMPPSPAYQQIIKGLPAVDYTRESLIYAPRNKRSHKVYGYSHVEQIVATVNIALRRQLHQLQFYTEGNIPEAILGVPESWTPENIKQFQSWWDSLIEGNTAQRRHAKFVPGGVSIHEVRPNGLKDEMDDWLARLCCFAFSISPQAFVRDNNRATAETGKDNADEEGVQPIKLWIQNLLNRIIATQFGAPDLVFSWKQSEEVDALKQAQIDQIYLTAQVYSPQHVAERLGIDPENIPEPQPSPETAGPDNASNTDNAEKIEKAQKKSLLKPINKERPVIRAIRKELTGIFTDFFDREKTRIADYVLSQMAKADADAEVEKILNGIDFDGWTVLINPVSAVLEKAAAAGVKAAAAQLQIDDSADMFKLANKNAIEYARQRGATLVGMRLEDGELVPNMRPTIHGPQPEWAITDSTRQMLRYNITKAMEEGWSNDRLAAEIKAAEAFSGYRAKMIARTETAFADTQGNVELWRATGRAQKKRWLTARDDKVSPDCRANGEAGDIDFNAAFPSGQHWPPDHPHCRCSMIPIFD